jgi:uncharacterized membrane protein (UPF0127 family)
MRRILLSLASASLLLALTTFTTACGNEKPVNLDEPQTVSIKTGTGKTVKITAEIADEQPERELGLSGRRELAPDAGMLFLLDDGRHAGFWMKDTLIPLAAAFIGRCGEIVAIVEMQPNTLEIHNTPHEYFYGLEVNGGWFARSGVAVGDRVEIPKPLRQSGC